MTRNTATAWLRRLVADGFDPHTTAAWMRLELDRDPLVFRELMTEGEVILTALRQSYVRIHAMTESFRDLADAAHRAADHMPPELTARIKAALAQEAHRGN